MLRYLGFISLIVLIGCESASGPTTVDLQSASVAVVDRFSDQAGTMFQRSEMPYLPDPNQPIHFDAPPFLTKALSPQGKVVYAYNFDLMPDEPAPIYVLFRKESGAAVENQMNIVNVIPGDPNYNDFWQVVRVLVPEDYVANSVTSYREIKQLGFKLEETDILVNCPIVPRGSTANRRYNDTESSALHAGWYQNKIVYYFTFGEHPIPWTPQRNIRSDTVYTALNVYSGSAQQLLQSGFKLEKQSNQTHLVLSNLPGQDLYSPLKRLLLYEQTAFSNVTDLPSARQAPKLAQEYTYMNLPTISTVESSGQY